MRSILFAVCMLFAGTAFSLPIILHSDTYEAGDLQSWVDPWYDPTNPLTVGPTAGMTSNSLWFKNGDQVEYAIDAPYRQGTYSVEFDMLIESYAASGFFRVLIDSPSVQTLTFDQDDGLLVYTSGGETPASYLPVGNYPDNALMHVKFDFNMPADSWLINIDGNTVYNGEMYGSGFMAIRFASSGASTYLDNVVITTAPIPASAWLFSSALAGLGWLRRKQFSGMRN